MGPLVGADQLALQGGTVERWRADLDDVARVLTESEAAAIFADNRVVLDRRLVDRRIWPAMDIKMSGTRREEMILSKETLDGVTMLRRSLVTLSQVEAMETLIRTLDRFPTNKEFLARVKSML